MFWKKLLYYLNPLTMFRKPEHNPGINVRLMHGINRISILMFLIGLIVVVIKLVNR